MTTSTGPVHPVASVPMTSSASKPSTPTQGMPIAASTSSMTGTWGASASGVWSPPSGATRCALYDAIASTRNAGRQSASMQATSRSGRCVRTSWAIMSISPRTALTGVPSGAVTDSGMP